MLREVSSQEGGVPQMVSVVYDVKGLKTAEFQLMLFALHQFNSG